MRKICGVRRRLESVRQKFCLSTLPVHLGQSLPLAGSEPQTDEAVCLHSGITLHKKHPIPLALMYPHGSLCTSSPLTSGHTPTVSPAGGLDRRQARPGSGRGRTGSVLELSHWAGVMAQHACVGQPGQAGQGQRRNEELRMGGSGVSVCWKKRYMPCSGLATSKRAIARGGSVHCVHTAQCTTCTADTASLQAVRGNYY